MTDSEIRKTPHWYILQYPLNRNTIGVELEKAGLALEKELKGGKINDFKESLSNGLNFYAPNFFNLEECKQKMSRIESSIFQNYVFVYGSLDFIYYLKKTQLPSLFMFRSTTSEGTSFPYVEQYVIDELKTLEKKDENKRIPYIPFVEEVAEGDKVKITEGEYRGFVATAVHDKRKYSKKIVLNVGGWLVVPLCTLKPGCFEIIEYSKTTNKPYIPVDISKNHDIIISGLTHHHKIEELDSKEAFAVKAKAQTIIDAHKDSAYSAMTMRCKHAAMMLYASTICQEKEDNDHYKSLALRLLEKASCDYDKAVIYTALFGCYLEMENFQKVNAIVQSWDYDKCTKNKQLLLDDLKLFYEWYLKLSKKKPAYKKVQPGYDVNEKRWFMLNAYNVKTRLISVLGANKTKHFCPATQSKGFKESEMEILKDKVFAFASYNELAELRQENDEVKLVKDDNVNHSYVSFSKKTFDSFKKLCKAPVEPKEIITSKDVISKLKRCSVRTIDDGPLKGVEGYITLHNETQQSKLFVVLDNMLAVSATITE